MKLNTLYSALVGLTLALTAPAQTPPSGHIKYEVMQRVDLSQLRMVINGQEVRPGAPLPGGGTVPDVPETRSYGQELIFAGNYAHEKRDEAGGMMTVERRVEGGPGGSETRQMPPRNMGRPFGQQRYLDLASGQSIEVMTLKKDSVSKIYRSDSPLQRAAGWQDTDKTKKVAGYTCHKATCPLKGETYTIWYTTDLPMTYSPMPALTPAKGVVLQIEGENAAYKATSVDLKAVAETEVTPPATAVSVTKEEMDELRKKAMADFRQRMMSAMPEPR